MFMSHGSRTYLPKSGGEFSGSQLLELPGEACHPEPRNILLIPELIALRFTPHLEAPMIRPRSHGVNPFRHFLRFPAGEEYAFWGFAFYAKWRKLITGYCPPDQISSSVI